MRKSIFLTTVNETRHRLDLKYYLICSLRNRVNHALTGKDGLKLTAGRTDSRNEIRRVLEVFIDQYSKACESVMKPQEILCISREETAAYIKKHKISLENSSQETGLPA